MFSPCHQKKVEVKRGLSTGRLSADAVTSYVHTKRDAGMHIRSIQARNTVLFEENNRNMFKTEIRDQGSSLETILLSPVGFFPLPNLHCLYPNPRDLLADISCLETPGIKSPHKAPLQTQFSGSEAVLLSVTNGLMQSFHYGINVCTFLTPHRYKTRLPRLM